MTCFVCSAVYTIYHSFSYVYVCVSFSMFTSQVNSPHFFALTSYFCHYPVQDIEYLFDNFIV